MAANIGTATVDVTITGSAARLRALELAVEAAKIEGAGWDILGIAKSFAGFLEGK
jgi:hypothetical protein